MSRFHKAWPLLVLLASPVAAQKKDFTVRELFAKETAGRFRGELPTLRWLEDGKSYLRIETTRESKRANWTKVDVATGKVLPLYDVDRLQAALVAAGVEAKKAEEAARQKAMEVRPAGDALLFSAGSDLWVWRLGQSKLVRLTNDAIKEEQQDWSPDGRQVAFVRANDLYAVAADGAAERRLTRDGSKEMLNGILDWVYQEEIYGRGKFRGFWWSPDSSAIAYLQLDESAVPSYPLIDDLDTHPEVDAKKYPKAGDPLPVARLGVVAASGGDTAWADLSSYGDETLLLVRVGWTPDSSGVFFQAQNREQTWLDLLALPRTAGSPRRVLRETTPAFTSVQDEGLSWLADGSFLWLSERDGWCHIYHYDGEGRLRSRVTSGEWEVTALHGADEKNGWIYYSGTERSAIGEDAWRVRLDGSGRQRLTAERGSHRVLFDDSYGHLLDTSSDLETPPSQSLHRADGSLVRRLDDGAIAALEEYRISSPELLRVANRDGFEMQAMLIKPPDFDPAKKYPVMMFSYGGPHAPSVRDTWGRATGLWYQLLAQRGVVVWVCDNRTASGRGAVNTWPLWKEFGKTELADIEDGLSWLKTQPWIDGDRIGISGWSYGGFMTLYALTHSKSFALGIAGGSVTDWRNYDAVYTERFLLTPKNNPEGYRTSSPLHAAADLHGSLLLVHGTIDDNVHPQNTMQMVHALQKAGKPFELMLYPKSKHGVTDDELVTHMRQTMTAFILDRLVRTAEPQTEPMALAAD